MHNIQIESLTQELLDVQRTLGWMDLVLGSIEDAVCVTNAEDKIVFANESFAKFLGTPRVFLMGNSFKDVMKFEEILQPLDEYRHLQPALASKLDENYGIFAWQDKNSSSFTFRISSRLLHGNDQRVYLLQNITHEYALAQMKNSFINLASHQLRTPMTAIMNYAHMLSEGYAGKLHKDQQQYADTIVQASERMITLINDLLNIARLQGGMQQLKNEPVRLENIINQIYTELRPQILAKKLNYHCEVAKDTPEIYIDTAILYEILTNLIINAVQYTNKTGSISISVKAVKHTVVVKIKDTGIGIPADYQSKLFDQFARADNAVEAFSEGTGLGLYLVKLLLSQIGGKISFVSQLNKGTTFRLALPIGSNA